MVRGRCDISHCAPPGSALASDQRLKMRITEEATVGEIAAAEPSSIRVFEALGIDYCCGGKRGLAEACSRIGTPVEEVISRITQAEHDAHAPAPAAWAQARLSAIIRHIVDHHHAYVRNETPRIGALLEKVVSRHGKSHAYIGEIQNLFLAATQELENHMLREEQVLFPHIVRMEDAAAAGLPLPPAFFGSVAMPISHMIAEHDDAGALFASISQLAGGYVPPEAACGTFQALYHGLHEFERDLHEHVHLENNVLFLRAIALERGN